MNYQTPKRTRPFEWAVCIAYAVAAIFFVCAEVYNKLYGTTPKDKLVTITGIAEEADVSTVSGRYGNATDFLNFRVGPYVVSYASKQNGFARLVNAVRDRKEITIGVSTAQETIFPHEGWVPLYEVSIEDDVICTYEDTLRDSYRSSNSSFFIPVGLLVAFGWCLRRCYTNRNLPLPIP